MKFEFKVSRGALSHIDDQLCTSNKDCAASRRYRVIDIYKAELWTLFTVVSNEKEISTGAVNCFATNLSSIG